VCRALSRARELAEAGTSPLEPGVHAVRAKTSLATSEAPTSPGDEVPASATAGPAHAWHS
jgi:hypothetical protein